MLLDKEAIDRGAKIEIIHHTQDGMIDIWADDRALYCLNMAGRLDIVYYRTPGNKLAINPGISDFAFHEDNPMIKQKRHAITLSGNDQYLAAAVFDDYKYINTIWLMNRKGKVLSHEVCVNAYPLASTSTNTIDRMEFCIASKCLYLYAQKLFGEGALYLVNPLRIAKLVFIKSIKIGNGGICWPIVPLPGDRDRLVIGTNESTYSMAIKQGV